MLIFELIGQYESICRMAMSGCAAKLNKSIKTNIIETLILIMSIPRKINFLQLGRHGKRGEFKAKSMTLSQWYISVLKRHRDQLLKITDRLVADAAFSVRTFVDGLLPIGFHLVSRLRNDAVLYYLYDGKPTGKRGRPRVYDGKIDFSDLDLAKMAGIDIAVKGEKAYELVARSKALGRNIKLVIHILKDGTRRLYFSTDTTMSGIDVFDIYRTRFQIEFCYRDGHQFTGLRDCQARDEKRLDFAFNASFAAVNAIKVMRKEFNLDISIGQIKSLMVSAHLLHRFFSASGIYPNTALNAKLVKELFGIAARAA